MNIVLTYLANLLQQVILTSSPLHGGLHTIVTTQMSSKTVSSAPHTGIRATIANQVVEHQGSVRSHCSSICSALWVIEQSSANRPINDNDIQVFLLRIINIINQKKRQNKI